MSKKTAIISSFMDLLNTSSIKNITIKEITDKSNIGKSTFYEYFKDKNDLVCESISLMISHIDDAFDENFSKLSPDDKLFALMNMGFNEQYYTKQIKELMFEFWILALSDEGEKAQSILTQMYEQYFVLVQSIIEDGKSQGIYKSTINSAIISKSLLAIFDGYQFHNLTIRNRDFKTAANEYINTLIKFLKGEI